MREINMLGTNVYARELGVDEHAVVKTLDFGSGADLN